MYSTLDNTSALVAYLIHQATEGVIVASIEQIVEHIGTAAIVATNARKFTAVDGGMEFIVGRGNLVRVTVDGDGTYMVQSVCRRDGEVVATWRGVSVRELGDVVYTAGP